MTFIGICIVGYSAVANADSNSGGHGNKEVGGDNKLRVIIGIILVLLGCVSNGAAYVLEGRIFETYYIPSLKTIGVEGAYGVLLYLAILPIAWLVKCPSKDLCNTTNAEDPAVFIEDA